VVSYGRSSPTAGRLTLMMLPFPDANLPDRDSSEGCVEGRSLPGTSTSGARLELTARLAWTIAG
jgi:hypothetical protein